MTTEKKLEIERRFILRTDHLSKSSNETIFIEQYYKKFNDCVIRYRRSVVGSSEPVKITFEKIIKRNLSDGVNEEENFNITKELFIEEIKDCTKSLSKIRNVYYHKDLKFEVDSFHHGVNLVIMEVELSSINDLHKQIEFPFFIAKNIIKEITGDKDFSNYALANTY